MHMQTKPRPSKHNTVQQVGMPSVSFRNPFMAVSTTVIESFSGSIKSNAFAMAMNTSVLILAFSKVSV